MADKRAIVFQQRIEIARRRRCPDYRSEEEIRHDISAARWHQMEARLLYRRHFDEDCPPMFSTWEHWRRAGSPNLCPIGHQAMELQRMRAAVSKAARKHLFRALGLEEE